MNNQKTISERLMRLFNFIGTVEPSKEEVIRVFENLILESMSSHMGNIKATLKNVISISY